MNEAEQALTGISYRGIQADAYFSLRVILQLRDLGAAGSYVAQILAPWYALYLHEGRRVLRVRLPQLHTLMSVEASQTFEQSRHGLKMFLDRKRDIATYESYFAEIETAHRARFMARVQPIFRGLADDLGVTTYRGKLVMTTHGVAFALGLEPTAILDEDMGGRIKRLWHEAGQSFSMAALAVDGPAPAVVGSWEADQFAYRDVKARKFYASVFTGPEYPHLNAVLLHYVGMINAIDLLFPIVVDLESDEYAIFKMRYLVTAHVLGSLRKLAADDRTLNAESTEHLRRLVEEVPSPVSTERSWLRNLLVHYEPNPKTDLAKFDRDRLLSGIVSMAEVPEDLDGLIEQTNQNLTYLADGLNAWMAQPGARTGR